MTDHAVYLTPFSFNPLGFLLDSTTATSQLLNPLSHYWCPTLCCATTLKKLSLLEAVIPLNRNCRFMYPKIAYTFVLTHSHLLFQTILNKVYHHLSRFWKISYHVFHLLITHLPWSDGLEFINFLVLYYHLLFHRDASDVFHLASSIHMHHCNLSLYLKAQLIKNILPDRSTWPEMGDLIFVLPEGSYWVPAVCADTSHVVR